MGLFAKKQRVFSPWSLEDKDFISDSLNNYDPHLVSIMMEVTEFIPEKLRDQVFVGGGFPAHLAGITIEHNDIDLFCMTHEAFYALMSLVHNDPRVTDRMDKREALDVQTRAYGKVIKFKDGNGYKIDLVDFHDRAQGPTIMDCMREFDINWSMAAIDLVKQEITIHREALSSVPRINPARADIYIQGTIMRIPKYRDRLRKEPDRTQCEQLIKIAKRREEDLLKEEAGSSSWY